VLKLDSHAFFHLANNVFQAVSSAQVHTAVFHSRLCQHSSFQANTKDHRYFQTPTNRQFLLLNNIYTLDVIGSPQDFLKAIGRGMDSKISTENWQDFWKTAGVQLRKDGLAVKDRRCANLIMHR
jgi:hypothetical protein